MGLENLLLLLLPLFTVCLRRRGGIQDWTAMRRLALVPNGLDFKESLLSVLLLVRGCRAGA